MACKEISTALDKLSTALHLNGLTVNKEKTVTMLTPPQHEPIGLLQQITCQGQALQMISETSILGVTVGTKHCTR